MELELWVFLINLFVFVFQFVRIYFGFLSSLPGLAETFNWTEDMGPTVLVKEPIGVVGCITPWNWPLNQIAAKVLSK